MSKSHNKKRNIGIIYSQLIQMISESVVSGDKIHAKKITDLLRRHFHEGTELYREFRLFNALSQTSTQSEAVAVRILEETRKAALKTNAHQIQSEKGKLIKEINYTLGRDFYDRKIADYRNLATIGTLLSDWRKNDIKDIARIATYETIVVESLIEGKKTQKDLSEHVDKSANILAERIMLKKYNRKYTDVLSPSQGDIIQRYVFSITEGKETAFRDHLMTLLDRSLSDVEMYSMKCENSTLKSKLSSVSKRLNELKDTNVVTDEVIAKFLLVTELTKELKGDTNE